APCSPMTQASASTTFDFPEPLGPTTHVMPGSSSSFVAEANDLKPRRVRVLRCMVGEVYPAASFWGSVHVCGARVHWCGSRGTATVARKRISRIQPALTGAAPDPSSDAGSESR